MRVLNLAGGSLWLVRHGWDPFVPENDALIDRPGIIERFAIPGDSGSKTALARVLAMSLRESQAEGILWISPFGTWPSAQNPELFAAYRRSFGEYRSLKDAPYHLFGPGDYVELECLIDLVLYFVWDAVLVDYRNGVAFQFSHDDWLAVDFERDSKAKLSDSLCSFGFRKIEPKK